MNFNFNRLMLLLAIAIIPFYVQAARMFILFNEDCMERLEYSSPNKSADLFVAYQINVGDGEKVILEIGQESKNTTTKIPTPTIGCNDGIFNLSMVQKINSRMDEVFLVVPKSNRKYTVSPINFASYFSVKNDIISVKSPKYQFEFNTKEGSIGENISTVANADVFFEGRLEQECTGAYVFRQIAQGSRTPYTDLVLIPEVGVIEIREGLTLDQALTNTMRLTSVNDDTFEDYLKEKCEESLPNNVIAKSTPGQPTESEVTPVGPIGYDMTNKNGQVQPANRQPNNSTLPTASNTTISKSASPVTSTAAVQYHVVQKGETLYRISKMYGVSVDQVKNWNGLNSNLIKTGSQLQVGTGKGTETSKNTIANANEVVTNPPYFPAPYNTTYKPTENTLTSRGVSENENTYVVKPGDTVASLAMKFGYTERKFREINDMGNAEFIKIGQTLKTSDCNCPPMSNNTVNTVDTPQEFNFVDETRNDNNSSIDQRSFPVNYSDTPITVSSNADFNKPANTDNNQFIYSTPAGNTSSPSPLYTPRGTGDNSNSLYNTEQNPSSSRQASPYDAIIPNSFDTYSPITAGNNDNALKGLDYNSKAPVSNKKIHVVQEGENIFQIARLYSITPERLRALNNLEVGEIIIPTQKLYVE